MTLNQSFSGEADNFIASNKGHPHTTAAVRKSRRATDLWPLYTTQSRRGYLVMERFGDVMRLCCKVSADRQMKAAFKHSSRGAVVAGGIALLGGLLMGPPGIAVGGALGGLLGWKMTSGQFQAVPEILMELPREQQMKLYQDVMAVLGSLDWTDAVQLVALVKENASIQQRVAATILSYVTKELRAEIRYGD